MFKSQNLSAALYKSKVTLSHTSGNSVKWESVKDNAILLRRCFILIYSAAWLYISYASLHESVGIHLINTRW